ncbi:histidine kinase [Streptacidiphilus sp. N1-10]|uniref:histidine kinase n=1 Tax=Streptacidiphilus jeojiensis TaxID=3229225 RepID=A0ABV6XWH6_9ACTN
MRHGSSVGPEELFPPEFEQMWQSPLARRLVRTARRVHLGSRSHALPLDAALALVALAAGLAGVIVLDRGGQTVGPAETVLLVGSVLGQAVPLVWRRRAALPVLAVVMVSSTVQWWINQPQRSVVAVLIAMYSASRYARLRWLPWSIPFLAAALSVPAFRVVPFREHVYYSLFFLYATGVAAVALGLVVRVRQAQLDALADRAARLEVEREQRVQLATLAERSRVSREMHDIIGHNLAVMIGLADGAAFAAANDPARGAEVLPVIASTGRQALSELRRTLSALNEHPDDSADGPAPGFELAPQPGLADLAPLLERIGAAGPQITHRTVGDLTTLAPGVQLTVYRIVQEALTNSLKHAGPTTGIQVVLRVLGGVVDVRVQDSGRPEEASAAPRSGHAEQGLVGIHERAVLAGGTASAGPTREGGWLVHAVVPLTTPPTREEDQP